jgi:hypothetical protein
MVSPSSRMTPRFFTFLEAWISSSSSYSHLPVHGSSSEVHCIFAPDYIFNSVGFLCVSSLGITSGKSVFAAVHSDTLFVCYFHVFGEDCGFLLTPFHVLTELIEMRRSQSNHPTPDLQLVRSELLCYAFTHVNNNTKHSLTECISEFYNAEQLHTARELL